MVKNNRSVTLLYIASATRSGSTLLDMLLGNHPQAVSVGELRRLHEYYQQDGVCTCGESLSDCVFWQRVGRALSQQEVSLPGLATSLPSRLPRRLGFLPFADEALPVFLNQKWLTRVGAYVTSLRRNFEVAANCWSVIDAIAETTQARLIVDSSKWAEQAKLLYLLRPDQVRLIFLVRDGRGVARSWQRRTGKPVGTLALSWTLNNIRAILLQMSIPKQKRLTVRYEDLCQNPAKELRRICNFARLPFENSVLTLNKSDRHNIGGSPHRFEKTETKIVLDEQWRASFSAKELVEFNLVAGFLNRLFGYTH